MFVNVFRLFTSPKTMHTNQLLAIIIIIVYNPLEFVGALKNEIWLNSFCIQN
jgi:hypothetical protein